MSPNTHLAATTKDRSASLQPESCHHRRLGEAGVEGEEDEAGVEAVAGLDGGFDAGLDGGGERRVGGLRESLGTGHAVGEELGGGGEVGGPGLAAGFLLELAEGGELHGFGHQGRVEVDGAQRRYPVFLVTATNPG